MTAPEFRYPFRLRDAFQDTRNNTELEIFLNTFVLRKDDEGNVDMDGGGIDNVSFVDIGRAHFYPTGVNITTAVPPSTVISLTGGTGTTLASGQVWHFTWGGYVETSVTSAGTWTFELRSGAGTKYGAASRLTSTWHAGDDASQGGTFGGSCIVETDHTAVQIVLTVRTVTGGTQLVNGPYIVGLRLA